MLRFVVIALIVIVAWVLLLKLFRDIKASRWTGRAGRSSPASSRSPSTCSHVTGIGEF